MSGDAPIWVDVGEAERWLEELIGAVAAGRRFVITRDGNPVAMPTPFPTEASCAG